MKDEDILKIAMQCDPEFTRRTYYLDLLNFGAAVAAAERERCANICDHERGTAGDAADKIRMLSNVEFSGGAPLHGASSAGTQG